MAASLRLTRWLRCRYGIGVNNVIGHSESLRSPYHRERVDAAEERRPTATGRARACAPTARSLRERAHAEYVGHMRIAVASVLSSWRWSRSDAADAATKAKPRLKAFDVLQVARRLRARRRAAHRRAASASTAAPRRRCVDAVTTPPIAPPPPTADVERHRGRRAGAGRRRSPAARGRRRGPGLLRHQHAGGRRRRARRHQDRRPPDLRRHRPHAAGDRRGRRRRDRDARARRLRAPAAAARRPRAGDRAKGASPTDVADRPARSRRPSRRCPSTTIVTEIDVSRPRRRSCARWRSRAASSTRARTAPPRGS